MGNMIGGGLLVGARCAAGFASARGAHAARRSEFYLYGFDQAIARFKKASAARVRARVRAVGACAHVPVREQKDAERAKFEHHDQTVSPPASSVELHKSVHPVVDQP